MNTPASYRGTTPFKRWRFPLLLAAVVVVLTLVIGNGMGQDATLAEDPIPASAATILEEATPDPDLPVMVGVEPEPPATPTPIPTPTPTPYDFTQYAPESPEVDMSWFDDALFLGDSRTDGLRLYSGIIGPTFLCSKGISVFDAMDDSGATTFTVDGEKYTLVEALETNQYAKVYISLGINELGYYNDSAFEETFCALLDLVAELQPNAVIYLQRLIPVNAVKCAANNQPNYVTNGRVDVYNAIFDKISADCQVVLVDTVAAMVDESGTLPLDATSDGVHFTKTWYQKWLAYLMCHTVDADEYFAGQTAV